MSICRGKVPQWCPAEACTPLPWMCVAGDWQSTSTLVFGCLPSGGLGVTIGKDWVQLRAVAVTSWLLILPFTRVDSAKPCNGWTVLPLNQCLPHGQGLITGLLGICTLVVPTKSKKTLLGRVSSGLCSVLNAPLCGASLASASQQDLLSRDGQHKPLPRVSGNRGSCQGQGVPWAAGSAIAALSAALL